MSKVKPLISVGALVTALAYGSPVLAQVSAGQAPTAQAPTTQAPTAQAPAATSSSVPDSGKGGQLEEIVVTAQRTNESLQKVPIAVSAITAASAEVRGLTSLSALTAAVPALDTHIQGSSPVLFLRGVGTNDGSPNVEQSVALYVDGVYYPFAVGNAFSFNNIERIEVLKGPQGTLFGRNATAGVVQIVTRDPQQTPTMKVSIGYGNYQDFTTQGYLSGGLTPNLAADIAVNYEERDKGYGRDIVTGLRKGDGHNFGARSKLLFTPTDSTKIRLTGDYSNLYNNLDQQLAPGVTAIDGQPGNVGRYDTREGNQSDDRSTQWGLALRVDQELNFARAVSITSYRHQTGLYQTDLDFTALPVFYGQVHQRTKDWTQELQLLSPKGSKITWLLGAFYFHARAGNDPINIAGAAAAPFPDINEYGIQTVNSGSIYGQGTAELFDATHLTLGLRYTNEKVSVVGHTDAPGVGTIFVQTPESQKLSRLTWRIALDHDFTDDVKGYVSYNRGIKSGGFNLFLPVTEFKPETLDSYEVGLKSELFDRHLRFNVAGFYYNYKNIQVTTVTTDGTTSGNAAQAHIYGADFDVQARIGRLNLSGGGSYLHGRYVKYPGAVYTPNSPSDPLPSPVPNDAAGNPTTYSPTWTGNLQADYTIPASFGDVTLSGSVAYFSGSSDDPFNTIRNPSYELFNGSVNWKVNEHLSARLWMHNITDANYVSARFASAFGTIQIPAPPRTYGGTLTFDF